MGKGDVVALGFFEKAVGLIFCVAGVRASNIPNRRRSVTLSKNMDDLGTMQPAALFWRLIVKSVTYATRMSVYCIKTRRVGCFTYNCETEEDNIQLK